MKPITASLGEKQRMLLLTVLLITFQDQVGKDLLASTYQIHTNYLQSVKLRELENRGSPLVCLVLFLSNKNDQVRTD